MNINLRKLSRTPSHLRWPYLVPYLTLLFFIAGCGSSVPPAVVTSFASGGLGLTKAAWEQQHTPSNTFPGPIIAWGYDANRYQVYFWTIAKSVSSNSTIVKIVANVSSGEDSKTVLSTLLPTDAQLKNTLQTTGLQGTFTEIYESPSLAQQYPALSLPTGGIDLWQGMAPGTIQVVYTHGASPLIIQAGNQVPPASLSSPPDKAEIGTISNLDTSKPLNTRPFVFGGWATLDLCCPTAALRCSLLG